MSAENLGSIEARLNWPICLPLMKTSFLSQLLLPKSSLWLEQTPRDIACTATEVPGRGCGGAHSHVTGHHVARARHACCRDDDVFTTPLARSSHPRPVCLQYCRTSLVTTPSACTSRPRLKPVRYLLFITCDFCVPGQSFCQKPIKRQARHPLSFVSPNRVSEHTITSSSFHCPLASALPQIAIPVHCIQSLSALFGKQHFSVVHYFAKNARVGLAGSGAYYRH